MTTVHRRTAVVPACALVLAACGASGDRRAAEAGSVSPEVVESCAGITREKAALLLGIDASLLTDYSRTEGKLRTCLYTMASQRSNTVAFTLSLKPSESDAKAAMTRAREDISMAQGVIDRETGSTSGQAAVQEASAGDDAFASPVNGAITMRVRNVIAMITSPRDAERKKRVADAIAEGLRQ